MSHAFTFRKPLKRASHLRSLEPRYMFDGAAVVDASHAAQAAASEAAAMRAITEAPAAVDTRSPDASRDAGRKEVVFVDTSVANHRQLMTGMAPGKTVVEFDGTREGLTQLAQWAQQAAAQGGFDAMHILSHGDAGRLLLGTTPIDTTTVQTEATQAALATLGHALREGGDILLYGCEIGAGERGTALMAALSEATGADVAASDDDTGAARLGGDWQLERQLGTIEASPMAITGYEGLLAVTTFASSDGDLGYTQTSVQRTSGGRTFTFSGGGGAGGLATDPSFGPEGLYAYEGTMGGNDIKLTIAVESGYSFDISSFKVGALSGSITIALTYGNNSTTSFTESGISTGSFTTLSSFGTAINDVKQVVITSADFGLFNDFDITDVKAIPPPPTVSDAYISITSSGSGTGGAYKIGDTVTASWNNTAGGQNQSGITAVTMDFSAFGGGSAVAATNSSGTWSASYLIASGAGTIDQTNRNVSVSASNSGGTTTTADTTNLTVDNVAPTVTDARISISGASGTGGAFKIGDTVTATWNNAAGGDNNSDTISSVTVDFSQFGGGSAVSASNSSGTWTATYTITSGAIDTTSRNVSVTATDNAGNTTTRADTTNATVDNVAPTVSDARISISGASGTGGAFKIGDTVTATWNNTAGGDNNSDTISSVTVDFSQFGGGSAVSASNASGTWTATYTLVAGAINGTTNRNVSVTATDNAGNATTTADTTNATVDNVAPTTTISTQAFSSDTGNSSDFITATASQTISGTLSANLASGETVLVSLDNGATWAAASATVGQNTWTLAGQTLSGSNTLKVKVQDGAGNDGTTSSQAYVLDTGVPSAPSTPDMTSGTDSGTSTTDNITSDTTPTFTGTAESGSTVTLYDTDGTTVLGTATASGGNWSITASTLSEGSHTVTAKATDTAGNVSSASSGLSVSIDASAPTGLNLDNTTFVSANTTATSTVATLSATDGQSITYSLATGNGTNDADNGSFTITGSSLKVGGASLTAGTYKIYVAATDAAGNVANQAFTLTVVDAPSVASIVRAGGASATVNTATTSISYTVTFDQAVTGVDTSDFALTATGTASGSVASVSGSGTTYTVVVDTISGDGTLRLDLNGSGTGIQNGGNAAILSGYTSGQTYTLDHTAPNAPATPDMSSGTDSGTSSTDNITNHTTPTFTGTAESGSTVTLYDTDGTTVLGTATATGGNWSITASTLSEGSHTLTAKASDAAGNVSSASSGLAVSIDASAPTGLNLDSTTFVSANSTATSTVATLSATDGQSITYSLATGNGTNDADNGSFTITGSSLKVGGASLTAGTYKIYVAATDAAGNVANQAFTLTVVDAPSVASIVRTGGASATVNTATTSISYTVTFDQAVTGVDTSDFTLTATGTASGNVASVSGSGTTYTVVVDTISGDGTLRLDLNGSGTGIQNGGSAAILSGYTSGQTYTLDHTAPNAPATPDMSSGTDSGTSSTDNITSDTTPTFTGTAESGSTVTLYDTDGTTVLGTATATGSNWSITASTLSEGSHTVTAKASDAAGNVSSASSGLNATIDTSAPVVSSVSVPASGSYRAGTALSFTVNTSEAVTVDTGGGTPRLALNIGGTTVYAGYQSGSGSSALVFSYTVQAGDTDADGIAVSTLQANGGTLSDTAGNTMPLTLNSVGATTGVLVDTTAPTVNAVTVPSNGTYVDGQTLDFAVQFAEAVTVDTTGGTPRVALTVGSTTVHASYLSGSGSSTLMFRYTVATGQQDTNGITVGALSANGGTLRDVAGNDATLTLNSVGSTASVFVDSLQPSITDVTSSTANGIYKAGDTLTITVSFSKAVTVDTSSGTPTLALNDGGVATYTSGSGTSTLTFTHVVGSSDNTADLDYTSTSALSLNNGTITDSSGTHQSASLTLATPGAAQSLGANKALVIDTTPPAITFSALALSADTGTSSSDFITATAAQTLTATLSSTLSGGDVVYGSLDNGSTWTDITHKVSGTTLSWNGITLSGSDTLRLKVTDSAGNDGTAASQAYVLDTSAPAITFSNLALFADTGSSNSDFITATAAQTITATLSAAPGGTDIVYGSLDNGSTWTDITNKVSGTTLTWDGVTLGASNTLRLRVTDSAGNDGTAASQAYVLDTTGPGITVSNIDLSDDSGTSSTDFITRTAAQTITATLSGTPAGTDIVYGSIDNGSTWTDITSKVTGTAIAWDGVTLTTSSTLLIKVTDSAGNDGPIGSQAYTFDATAPTLPTVSNLTTTSTTPTLTGTASLDAGESMTLTIGSAVYNVTPSGGTWSLDLATAVPVSGTLALQAGQTFVATVQVVDAAGNTASATGALNLAVPAIVLPPPPEPPAPAPAPAPPPVLIAPPPIPQEGNAFLSPATLATILPGPNAASVPLTVGVRPPSDTPPSPPSPPLPTLTRGGEGFFQITVMPNRAPGGGDSLVVNRPLPDQVLTSNRISFAVPADTFAQTNPEARVSLSAMRADGRPLPAWLSFNPQTGRFEGTPPPGTGDVTIRVIARDAQGHEAVTVFKIKVQANRPDRNTQSTPEPAGRPGLSAQIQLAAERQATGQRSGLDKAASPPVAKLERTLG